MCRRPPRAPPRGRPARLNSPAPHPAPLRSPLVAPRRRRACRSARVRAATPSYRTSPALRAPPDLSRVTGVGTRSRAGAEKRDRKGTRAAGRNGRTCRGETKRVARQMGGLAARRTRC
eukprot:4445932-Prymnesium_polylepis.1